MAINFLNTVDLNFNQLRKAAIESLAADPAAGVLGQVYYDTAVSALKICVTAKIIGGADAVWKEVGATSGVETLTTTQLNNSTGNTLTVLTDAIGNVTINSFAYNGGDNIGYVPTTGTATTFLRGDGTFQVPINTEYTADKGVVLSGTEFNAAIPAANQTATSAAITDTAGRTYQVQTLTTDAGNLVVNVPWIDDTNETYTLPVTAGVVTPSAPTSAKIELTAGGTGTGVKSTVEFIGTTNRIDVTSVNQNNGTITINLTDDVTIADDLTVTGIMTQLQTGETNTLASPLDMADNKLLNVATGTAGTDGVNLGQVELLVAGIGVFQGGYNATTDPGVPVISGSSNIKLDLGDYFVVSHDGDITFSGTTTTGVNNGALANSTALLLTAANTSVAVGMDVTGTGVPSGVSIASVTNSSNFVLNSAITIANTTTLTFSNRVVKVEVGDFIFANAAIAADSNPAKSAYTIVQSDANIAGAGATDGGTEKGVAGFDSASFDVSASGWVQLNSTRNPYGAKVSLNNTSPVSRAVSGGQTTFTVNIDDASIFGAGALAANVKVEVLDKASPLATVYPLVERSGSGSLAIKFSGDVAVDIYQVLLSHI